MSAPYEARTVEHLGGHRIRVTFADGLTCDVDLASRFAGSVGLEPFVVWSVRVFAQADEVRG